MNNMEILNSSVIRVFKTHYPMDHKLVCDEIVKDEVDFYAQKALDIKERMQDANLPQSYLGMGWTYELLGQSDLSEAYLKKAIQGGNIYTTTFIRAEQETGKL